MLWKYGHLQAIPGVGPPISGAIDEFIRTGRHRYLDRLERRVSPALTDLLTVPGIGPVRAKAVYDYLGVRSVAELAQAAAEHRIQTLPRFGAVLEAKIGREAYRCAALVQDGRAAAA